MDKPSIRAGKCAIELGGHLSEQKQEEIDFFNNLVALDNLVNGSAAVVPDEPTYVPKDQ